MKNKARDSFIGYVEGYLTTTGRDNDGDKLTIKNVRLAKEVLDKDPQRRILYENHNIDKPVAQVLKWKLHYKKGKWVGLWANVGVINRKTWAKIKNGELRGFSIGFKVIEKTRRG